MFRNKMSYFTDRKIVLIFVNNLRKILKILFDGADNLFVIRSLME